LHGCGAKETNAVRLGSTSSRENATIAEIYALALERARIPVRRKLYLGTSQSAMASLARGEIDVYPEYVRIDKGTPANRRRDNVMWLAPSPMDDSTCVATSQVAAEQYSLLTMSKCAEIAPQLRFAATSDFLRPGGTLERLRRSYGRFNFKSVAAFDAGAQYDALNRGDADVASAFTTDPQIAENHLIVLGDDKRFWPRYSFAPVIRNAVLHAHPRARDVLDRISATVTTYAVQQMNMRLDLLHMEPRDAAEYFFQTHHLLGQE
jgi:osmoprotectant transport system substrate-binding protein